MSELVDVIVAASGLSWISSEYDPWWYTAVVIEVLAFIGVVGVIGIRARESKVPMMVYCPLSVLVGCVCIGIVNSIMHIASAVLKMGID